MSQNFVSPIISRFDSEAANLFCLHKSKKYMQREIYELQKFLATVTSFTAISAKIEMIIREKLERKRKIIFSQHNTYKYMETNKKFIV